MKIEKAIAASIEPVVDIVVALEKKLEAFKAIPGPAGEDGKDGAPGEPGSSGPIGPAGDPGPAGKGWQHKGAFDPEATYAEGDIYVKNYGAFIVDNGEAKLLAGRGEKGERGAVGPAGDRGTDGRDGSTIIAAEVKGFAATITFQSGDVIDHITLDFSESFNEALAKFLGVDDANHD